MTPNTQGKIKKYSHTAIHNVLSKAFYKGDSSNEWCNQAMFCPYYVKLTGTLGADWGVIVNPESDKFGELVFEHDDCGCPEDWAKLKHGKDYQEIENAWEE